ncbi:hypothetical protein [Knoellia sp. p5-6-4]|uniref:hypothetical protein n=1 Tax=unclassified Knoellia TaxID=2618719 RepID=UPI0023DB8270|nr:hypothetical protein [Knoellia sp. p5-6-4]MDF2146761.1 hypothetical protein [Knoellia sp. p5-6-4]
MGNGFEIKFNGDWERGLNRMVQAHVDKLAKEGTRAADRVLASHGGQPVEVVKPILRRELKRAGFDVTDPELTEYAKQISDGGRVVIQADRVK